MDKNLQSTLHEDRVFPPSDTFSTKARIQSREALDVLRARAEADHEGFWAEQAERIDWIKAALQDPDAELYVGWDGIRKRYDRNHRVILVVGNYVVVIRLSCTKSAQFVTAFVADSPSTLQKIKRNPKWGSS